MVEARTAYAEKVGNRLRSVRRQKGLSLQAVEAASGMEFKASVLGAYERGERTISVPRLQRLARLYGVPVDQLLPPEPGEVEAGLNRGDGHAPRGRAPGTGAKVTIDLTRIGAVPSPEGDVLRRYLNAIQIERQDFNGRVLTIRDQDLRAIASLMAVPTEDVVSKLDDLGLRIQV